MADANHTVKLNYCRVAECGSLANRKAAQLCESHYMRLRRSGTTDAWVNPAPDELPHIGGYVLLKAKGHPMAKGGSRAYKHRVVYYDQHGAGPFACHWCALSVTWDTLHIDHLDDNPKNNVLSNLVASCATCNQARGRPKMLERWREKSGVTLFGACKTLNEWAAQYGISRPSIVSRLNRGWSVVDAITAPRDNRGPRTPRPPSPMHATD